jgi:hypothetical protein
MNEDLMDKEWIKSGLEMPERCTWVVNELWRVNNLTDAWFVDEV